MLEERNAYTAALQHNHGERYVQVLRTREGEQ